MSWLMGVLGFLAVNAARVANPAGECMHLQVFDGSALKSDSNPSIRREGAARAIGSIENGAMEPRQIWAYIANQRAFPRALREYCALQLFKRHVKPGMTVGEVKVVLAGANWLDEQSVYPMLGVAG